MPKEYIATPPPERPGAPWFLKVNGAVSYACAGDDGYPIVALNVEQYDWMYRSVMGSDVVDVRVTNLGEIVIPPSGGDAVPVAFTITGDIIPQ